MKLIEAEKAKDVIHEYFKSLMVNGASGTDVDRLAVGIGSCLKHDANLLKAVDELPSAEPDTTTHDSIPAETGKNGGDGTSGDCISRQRSVDALRKMQTYKLFAGDDMLLIDQAEAQTELMMLPPAQPEQRWIPVEERLPEPWTLVLVTDSCKNVSVCQMALNPSDGWYNEYENWTYFSTSVIAWMPLPEPYQEGGTE